ncbi:MAG: ribosome-binding factor A [Candidatus Pacebacteria bacterium]|nr:ribosome-binding factor A [Candidatus Paceibacterota bacterium]
MTLKQDKVKENIKNAAANFLGKESNRTSLITVTDANISKDMKKATLFISVLPESGEEDALNFVKRKRSDLRDYLKKNLEMRIIPFLDFELDMGEKNRQRIDELSSDL